eukprot:356968-Chlamydomonas_euryale.AAC.34
MPPHTSDTARDRSVGGIVLARMLVADDGATPSPRPTSTRDAHSASRLICAHGGASSVPTLHSATPALRTLAPPILVEM